MNHKSQRPTILVVDDEPAIGDIFRDFLSSSGYVVETTVSGAEALERMQARPYDLLITDLEMPGMNGIELLRKVHSNGRRIASLMMTSFATVDSAIEAMKLGAFDYITKPFKMGEVQLTVERALENLRLRNENMELRQMVELYRLTERIDSTLDLQEVLAMIVEALHREAEADMVALRLRDDKDNRQQYSRLLVQPPEFPLTSELVRRINLFEIMKKHRAGDPVMAGGLDISRYFDTVGLPRPIESFMSVPLKSKGDIIGMINAYSFTRGRNFTEGHRRFLYLMADHASGAIEKTRLHGELKTMFSETIEGLVSALEAKDRYTRGHSERVGNYSRMIAQGFGLPEEEVELLYHAGRLHDIGKIGMKLDMINKPGPLDKKELQTFRQHPVLSKEILDPIRFLAPVVPMAYYHHERWEGHGYPDGLAGEAIPFGARVVCVADSFDVMTSDRPYRRRLKLDVAISELEKCSGSQFDPHVVEVFINELRRSHYHDMLS